MFSSLRFSAGFNILTNCSADILPSVGLGVWLRPQAAFLSVHGSKAFNIHSLEPLFWWSVFENHCSSIFCRIVLASLYRYTKKESW